MATKLRRETLSEQMATQLLEYIRSLDIQPGTLLPSETRLSAEYGVSRQVVREALRSLQGRGVLTILNGRGAVVRPLDRESLSFTFSRAIQIDTRSLVELMEVRLGLEMQSATLASRRRTAIEAAELTRIVDAMRGHLHDEEEYANLDLAFHLAIARASHNTMLQHLVESIREATSQAIHMGLRHQPSEKEEPYERVQTGHEGILREILLRQPASAARAMARHLGGATNYFASLDAARDPASAHRARAVRTGEVRGAGPREEVSAQRTVERQQQGPQ